MSEERIEVERCEGQVVNENKKKNKRIVAIIITVILLLMVSISVLYVLKYKAEHRYISFEELDKEQIVLIQEIIALDEGEKWVYIRAVDAEGDAYLSTIPYDEWEGIESVYEDILNGKKTFNRIYDEEIKQIYNYILQIDENEDYYCISMTVLEDGESNILHRYYYGVRYMENGNIEYVMFWEATSTQAMYLLDDPAAKEVYYFVGSYL